MDIVVNEVRTQSKKEQQWNDAKIKVENLEKKDPHSLKIDHKIKQTVIGLTAFDIPTSMSCEGHLDHGGGYPYIIIGSPKARRYEHDAQIAYVIGRHEEHDRLEKSARQTNIKFLPQLQGYLNEFYSTRQTSDITRLTAQISNTSSSIYLASSGVSEQKTAALDKRSANLAAFQEEMEMFGKFLEQKFFS